jgi:hypothetical protein
MQQFTAVAVVPSQSGYVDCDGSSCRFEQGIAPISLDLSYMFACKSARNLDSELVSSVVDLKCCHVLLNLISLD